MQRGKSGLWKVVFPVIFLFPIFLLPGRSSAQESPPDSIEAIHPVAEVKAFDTPSDAGGSITITWELSPDDVPGSNLVLGYEIKRSLSSEGPWEMVGVVSRGANRYEDASTADHKPYFYQVAAMDTTGRSAARLIGPVESHPQWFNHRRAFMLIIGGVICAFIAYFIWAAKAGKKLFVRKIAGLEAIDEAIGRATEMGRPILFIPGIQDMNDVQTIAGVTILGRVAKTIAEYETQLEVPTCRSIVMTAARETVKEAYLAAGRPDAYSDDMIYYVTDEQFGYVAAVDGVIVRKKPATCFYMGAFFAESLILSETGNSIGAIQIAGTAMPSQLPFFIAACDYTLIGEELFAASAYLSGEARQLGSLKGQDVGKGIAMGAIVLGSIVQTIAGLTGNRFFVDLGNFIVKMFTT